MIKECSETGTPSKCHDAKLSELKRLKIDRHAYKRENGILSKLKFWDVCICSDGGIRIAQHGECGSTRQFLDDFVGYTYRNFLN